MKEVENKEEWIYTGISLTGEVIFERIKRII